jgi:hypothetical protein
MKWDVNIPQADPSGVGEEAEMVASDLMAGRCL